MPSVVTNIKPYSIVKSRPVSDHTSGHKISLLAYAVTSLKINGAKTMKTGSTATSNSTDPMNIGNSKIDEMNQRLYNYRWSLTE